MIIYIVSTALSLIMINQFEIQTNPSLVALISFLICLIFFNVMNVNRIKIAYAALFQHPIDFIVMNIITAIIWLGTFWGLKYISPALFVSIFMSVIPLTSLLIKSNKKEIRYTEIVPLFILIFSALALVSYENLTLITFTQSFFYGLLLAALSGCFSAIYMHHSQKMQKKCHFLTIDFLCIRFYFVILICFLLTTQHHIAISSILNKWYDFVIISILTTIIPLYSLQKAILTFGPMRVSCLITLTPLAAYFLQTLMGFQFNLFIFSTILMISLLLIQYYRKIFHVKAERR